MKKIFYIITFISFSRQVLGQTNLVLNPSFESTVSCPTGPDQVSKATNWSSYGGTSDYFNSCAPYFPCGADVPSNMAGYQKAATGNAYCGLVTFVDPSNGVNIREYIGAQLASPLVIGTKYYVSFKTCLSEGDCDGSTGTAFDFNIATNKIGVKFITYNFPFFSAPPVFNSAHIFSNSIITDSLNWTSIKGSFVADSNYNQIMIGNFFNDINTSTVSVGSLNNIAYYVIDDVVVSTDSLTQIIGINEFHDSKDYDIYPNPTADFVSIKISKSIKPLPFFLFDAFGQNILSQKITADDKIDISNLNDGLYFIQIISDNKTYYDKLIVRH